MVYISKNCQGFYLSQKTMKDLGIIEQSFPNSQFMTVKSEDKWYCPQRTETPSRPKQTPYEPTEGNISKFKTWLLEAFASSAFNQCPHEKLPEMTGESVKLHFKEGVTLYAAHGPIPIPHYWKQKVKDDIDRDKRLGIIEKVPQGTSAKWCARIIVTPKKNGDPRRTVDLQKLNNATLRETHHTPRPFDVVSTVPFVPEKPLQMHGTDITACHSTNRLKRVWHL